MNRLTPEQRFQIVKFYFENNGSVRNTYRALRPFYRRQNRPSEQLIRLPMERFRTTFTRIDNSHPQRRRTVRTEEAIATVERSIEEDPNESIRHRAQELDLCPSTIWKILRFVEWAQNEIAVVPDFHKRILLSDEAHFWLNSYVNKQNCRIWSEANPQVYVETPLHPEKLTVWCALWAGGIIGPYFFKNDEGHNVTVNGDRYRAMITNFFIPELNNHDVQELWFQQDGATCHTARATIDLLKDSLVYADKTQTLDHLEDNIRRVIADIRPQMLVKVIENWTSRLDYIRASRGSPMPQILFKIGVFFNEPSTNIPPVKRLEPIDENSACVEVETTHKHLRRGVNSNNFNYITCEEVKSVESTFLLDTSYVRATRS
ncbi:DUF4817 domain-containing protein [Trichonephila clavipes]|nr:DUF4817 domain-containing protein [Trichonephila clavipes]